MGERRYRPLSDYALLGDGHTAALVARDGSVDWCCWPHFDSPAMFLRLLDAERGGWFRVGPPAGEYSTSRSYVTGTNVLTSEYKTGSGTFRVTWFMPVEPKSGRKRGRDLEPSHRILVFAEGLGGESEVAVEFRPTFDFGRAETHIELEPSGASARAPNESVYLTCPARLHLSSKGCATGSLQLPPGDRNWIALTYASRKPEAVHNAQPDLDRTLRFWREWIGQCPYDGPYREMVRRSALTLKMLIFAPTGALVAAPTAGLPEVVGGTRNWDYRFSWLRDSSLILHALEMLGYYDEALNYFEWLEELDLHNRGRFQIMYTIAGGSELPEVTLDHLAGYRNSRPVRIGNAASKHVQLDIYGEVLDAAYMCFRRLKKKKVRGELWHMLSHLADEAARRWQEPDRSIWELRGEPRQFVYSKLLCWVALDRALQLAAEPGLEGNTDSWQAARDEIRDAILAHGYNADVGAFTQAFGSAGLDAAALAIQRVGFLPATDERIVSTTERIRERLTENGLVYRYRNDDGLPGRDNTFTMCGLWMVDNLAGQGRIDEAHECLENITRRASPEGLLSEEIDARNGELLGNYPQGFTHLSLIRAAAAIGQAEQHASDVRAARG